MYVLVNLKLSQTMYAATYYTITTLLDITHASRSTLNNIKIHKSDS